MQLKKAGKKAEEYKSISVINTDSLTPFNSILNEIMNLYLFGNINK
jgi:hypothetical protein